MQRELTENLNKIFQSFSKTATEVSELNVNFFNRLVKGFNPIEEVQQIKKPEDFVQALLQNTASFNSEAVKYTQQLSEIWIQNAADFNKVVTDLMRETSNNASRVMKTATKTKETA